MCLEGQVEPFVGIRIKKETKLNNAEEKVRADTRTAAPLDPFSSATRRNPALSPRGMGCCFGLAAESIQMSSGATGSTISALCRV